MTDLEGLGVRIQRAADKHGIDLEIEVALLGHVRRRDELIASGDRAGAAMLNMAIMLRRAAPTLRAQKSAVYLAKRG